MRPAICSSETSDEVARGAGYCGQAFFASGFRPFFLAASLYTTCAVFACLVPLIDLSLYDAIGAISGLGWVLGFGLVSLMLWPILTRPRPDGEPG